MPDSERNAGQPTCSPKLWEAVRYVSGELSADEAAAFEDRLADDLELAEALGDAVRLTECVTVCVRTGGDSRPTVETQPSAWTKRLLLASCAAGLLLVGWYAGGRTAAPRVPTELRTLTTAARGVTAPTDVTPPGPAAAEGDELETMLSAWVELQEIREPPAEEAVSEAPMVAETSGEVPDWMFVALQTPSEPGQPAAGEAPSVIDSRQEGSL